MNAAPLTFAGCSEAITTPLKYVAADANGSGQIEVSCPHPPEMALLVWSRTLSGKGEVEAGTGLGSRLINRVFSRQLNRAGRDYKRTTPLCFFRVDSHVPLQAKEVLRTTRCRRVTKII